MSRQRITGGERMNSGRNTTRSEGMNQTKAHRIAAVSLLNGNVYIISTKA